MRRIKRENFPFSSRSNHQKKKTYRRYFRESKDFMINNKKNEDYKNK